MDACTRKDAETILKEGGGSTHSNSLRWDTTIPFLREVAPKMKFIFKGIMTSEEALLAIKQGADAIVVSNHGARQLDSTFSTIEVLSTIHSALATRSSNPRPTNKIPIIFDRKARHGSDILRL